MIKVGLADVEHLLQSMMVRAKQGTIICIAMYSIEVRPYPASKPRVVEDGKQIIQIYRKETWGCHSALAHPILYGECP